MLHSQPEEDATTSRDLTLLMPLVVRRRYVNHHVPRTFFAHYDYSCLSSLARTVQFLFELLLLFVILAAAAFRCVQIDSYNVQVRNTVVPVTSVSHPLRATAPAVMVALAIKTHARGLQVLPPSGVGNPTEGTPQEFALLTGFVRDGIPAPVAAAFQYVVCRCLSSLSSSLAGCSIHDVVVVRPFVFFSFF